MNPLRILVVDDSASSRMMVKACLDGIERRIEEAENGEVAFTKFTRGAYDLVLMDIHMPVLDGYGATGKIRQWERQNGRKPTPIIALTALDHQQAVTKTREAGCSACVSKPVKKQTLQDTIRALTGVQASAPAAQSGSGFAQKLFGMLKSGDTEDYGAVKAMVPQFLAEKRREVDVISMAAETGDYETVRMLALRLKGEGANFGFREITDIGGELAAAAANRDPKKLRKLADNLASHLDKLETRADAG
jgi:CheY-like chemotaxis protein